MRFEVAATPYEDGFIEIKPDNPEKLIECRFKRLIIDTSLASVKYYTDKWYPATLVAHQEYDLPEKLPF